MSNDTVDCVACKVEIPIAETTISVDGKGMAVCRKCDETMYFSDWKVYAHISSYMSHKLSKKLLSIP